MQIEELIGLLDEYEGKCGLKKNLANNSVSKYLDMDGEVLSKLTSEECGEASYSLSNYALYLQREINRQHSIVKYCDVAIDGIIGRSIDNYGTQYSKYEHKRAAAISDNDVAKELSKVRNHADIRLITMSYLPARIESIVKTLLELQQSKRRNR